MITAPVADAGRRPPSMIHNKFEIRRPCIWQIWHTMCVSINGPGDLTFDLETGMRVASKVGNLLYKFGHSKPSLNYLLCIRWMDRLMDKSNTYCPFCTGPGA